MSEMKMSTAFETASPPFAIVAKATGARLLPRPGQREITFVFPDLPPDWDQCVINDEVPAIAPNAYIAAHGVIYSLIENFKRIRRESR